MHVIRYPYDPGQDKLDNHAPRRKRGLDAEEEVVDQVYQIATNSEVKDPSLWSLARGRWTKRQRRDESHADLTNSEADREREERLKATGSAVDQSYQVAARPVVGAGCASTKVEPDAEGDAS